MGTEPMSRAYLALRLAGELFGRPPERLAPDEMARLRAVADRQAALERRILASPEAAGSGIDDDQVERQLAEVRARYPDETAFLRELRQNGLDPAGLRQALARELRIAAALERAAAQLPPVTPAAAEAYYHAHPAAFTPPERRRLRHLLLTVGDAREETAARAHLDRLRATLVTAERFGAAALRYSHCPTSLEGGCLGVVRPGQLFPELDAAAFALAEGAVSGILASPVGLHLLRCDAILPAQPLPFAAVAERIVARLTDRQRAAAQRRWIATLPAVA